MDQDMLQPAAKPSPKIEPLMTPPKHAMYAWRSESLFDDAGKSFRGVRYSTKATADAGWVNVGPVGSLFAPGVTFQKGAIATWPLVQFARSLTCGTAYTLELAPAMEGTAEFNAWLERRSGTFDGPGETLGYALSPLEPVPDQWTLPLLSAEVRDDADLPLNQAITTDLTVWDNLLNGSRTAFSLQNPAVGGATPIAQIPPVFEIEIDLVGTTIVPTVRVGQMGDGPGDIVIPPGVGALIKFSRRSGTNFKLNGATFTLNGAPAPDFDILVDSEAQILVDNRAAPNTYDYTIAVTTSLGSVRPLDPKVKNRATVDGA